MVTKSDITTTFNTAFDSDKTYAELSNEEKLYALLVLTATTSANTLTTNQTSNPVLTTITFDNSTTSSAFTITNRLALIVCPPLTTTLTLQVNLNNSWIDTSISVILNNTAKTIEADELAKVSGAFNLSNAFRFISTNVITATLTVRSIVQ